MALYLIPARTPQAPQRRRAELLPAALPAAQIQIAPAGRSSSLVGRAWARRFNSGGASCFLRRVERAALQRDYIAAVKGMALLAERMERCAEPAGLRKVA